MLRIIEGLNEEGLKMANLFMAHGGGCSCASCRTVRQAGLVVEIIERPVCCGQEMHWQGDPANGFIGYECRVCGATDSDDASRNACAKCETAPAQPGLRRYPYGNADLCPKCHAEGTMAKPWQDCYAAHGNVAP